MSATDFEGGVTGPRPKEGGGLQELVKAGDGSPGTSRRRAVLWTCVGFLTSRAYL